MRPVQEMQPYAGDQGQSTGQGEGSIGDANRAGRQITLESLTGQLCRRVQPHRSGLSRTMLAIYGAVGPLNPSQNVASQLGEAKEFVCCPNVG